MFQNKNVAVGRLCCYTGDGDQGGRGILFLKYHLYIFVFYKCLQVFDIFFEPIWETNRFIHAI